MNTIKLTGIVAAGALLASSAAFAEGPKWTYVEGNYTQGNEDVTSGSDLDNDQYSLGGSFGFADMYHIQGYYIDGTTSVDGLRDLDDSDINFANDAAELDYDGYEIRAGINPAINDNTDFVTQIFYQSLDGDSINGTLDFNGEDVSVDVGDVDGYGVRTGLRSMLTEKVELSAYGVWADVEVEGPGSDAEDFDGKTTWAEIGGQYYWTEALSVGLDALIDDETSMRFSARWNF